MKKPSPERPKAEQQTPPLILVVEDYDDTRTLYAEYLIDAGFRVEQAKNGAEALEKALRILPDLILMDLSLPVMDGWEATRRIKDDAKTRDIPVVALTGQEDARVGPGLACEALLTKPCMPEAVVSTLRALLARPRKPSRVRAAS